MTKIAVIGFGIMGRNHHRVLGTLSDCEIVGVVDPMMPTGLKCPVFKDTDELLAKVKLDAAIIAVPTSSHFEIAKKCIQSKVALLIEKPVAATVAEAKELLALENKTGVRIAIGHIERFNPVIQVLRKELANKTGIFSISITRVGPIPPRINDVGILTDLAVHDIDLLRQISGKEIEESHHLTSRKIHGSHEDNAILSFRLSENIIANIITNWLTPFKKRTVEVATADAYFEGDLLRQELSEFSHFVYEKGSYVVRRIHVPRNEPLVGELSAFLNFVKTGNRGDLASITDSLITLEQIQSAR